MDKQTCPSCGSERAAFLIRADGTCDRCEVRAARARLRLPAPGPSWVDVRARRDRLLAASDWTQLPDVAEPTRERWRPYRQALRDITRTHESPADVVWPDPPA